MGGRRRTLRSGADTRLIAVACRALGDEEGADLAHGAARSALEMMGATTDAARLTTPDRAAPEGLTAREIEILALVATGKSNRAVAEDLFISEKTVASHVSHIFTKLGLSSRSGATAFAYENGLM